ncbi:hypothetical protein ABVB69_32460 [Streptomyces sp. NPDC000349]|uniref:hypothetical protein n=1 Tax=Streptomyces sp. NPDC000349 TaxID=3154249 RepID=UPI003369FCD2
MSEKGHSWRLVFQTHPAEAHRVRAWAGARLPHPDASQVANELFLSVLGSGSPTIEMTLSTAGPRTQVVAAGSVELSVLHSHGPGFLIVNALSARSGLNTDGQGMWALLTEKDET